MTTCFIASGPIEFASARIRAYWPAKYMKDTVAISSYDNRVVDADTYIWQKRYDLQFIKANQDKRHFIDFCDPVWWFSPDKVKELIQYMDGFVACTKPLADDFTEWSGKECHVIPDRLELSHYDKQRAHEESEITRFIWFGLASNRVALAGAWANLCRLKANGHNISLTILDDRPDLPLGYGDELPVYHTQWKLNTEVEIIAQHDIALLPPYPGPWGKMKSDNKELSAMACGLHVTNGLNYLFMRRWTEEATDKDFDYYIPDVKHSAAEWEALLCQK